MPTGTKAFSARPNVRSRLVVNRSGDYDIANNRSRLSIALLVEETAQQASWTYDPQPWNASIGGVPYSGSFSFDFRPSGNQSITLLSTSRWFDHNSDGTLTVLCKSDLIDISVLGTSQISFNYELPRIPRGPKVKIDGEWKNTVAYMKVDGEWVIGIPYVKDDGTWKIGGG